MSARVQAMHRAEDLMSGCARALAEGSCAQARGMLELARSALLAAELTRRNDELEGGRGGSEGELVWGYREADVRLKVGVFRSEVSER